MNYYSYLYGLNHGYMIKFTKELCYFLGYFWADGYLPKKYNGMVLEISTKDSLDIKTMLLKAYPFKFIERKKDNRKDCVRKGTTHIYLSDKSLKDFMLESDFNKKSFSNFEKIYSIIPKTLKKYFLRGYIDGDGCIYYNHIRYLYQFNISSCINQDWSSLEKIFKILEVKYTVTLREQKNSNNKISKYSKIQLNRYKDIIKFLSIVYKGYEKDKIGLKRKYNKYIEIRNYHK